MKKWRIAVVVGSLFALFAFPVPWMVSAQQTLVCIGGILLAPVILFVIFEQGRGLLREREAAGKTDIELKILEHQRDQAWFMYTASYGEPAERHLEQYRKYEAEYERRRGK